MFPYNLKIKLFITVLGILLFWQSFKFWSFYGVQQTEGKELVDKPTDNQQILVTVYYEALCPDSKSFIINQLLPTFNVIEDYMDIQLIPYGRAETIIVDNDFEFKCQHGKIECEANIVHACSVNKISDSRKLLELVACMIKKNKNPLKILKTCGAELNEYSSILICAQSLEGRRLLSKFGQLTDEIKSKLDFIPTIKLDDDFDIQTMILKNLKRQLCKRLVKPPTVCNE